MPGILSAITPKAPSSPPGGIQDYAYSTAEPRKAVPDALTLRDYKTTIPLVFRAITHRRTQVCNANWSLLPVGGEKPVASQTTLIQTISAFLRAPNATGRNNSFGGLWGPAIDDVLVLDLAAIFKQTTGRGMLLSLQAMDAARLKFNPDWDGSDDAVRYFLATRDDPEKGIPLLNCELIHISLNDVTYQQEGIPPCRILYRTLDAYTTLLNRIQQVQRRGGAATMLNIAGAGQENLKSIRRRIEQDIVPNSNILLTDFDLDDLKVAPLGSIDLVAQGLFEAYKIYVREIAAAFAISPLDLMQDSSVKYDSAETQDQISLDDGVKPLMAELAGYINREILPCWPGGATLEFSWDALRLDSEPEDAEKVRLRFGRVGTWLSVNDARQADGQEPFTEPGTTRTDEQTGSKALNPSLIDTDDSLDELVNYPLLAVGPGGVSFPLPYAKRYMEAQIAVLEAQAKTARDTATAPPAPVAPVPTELREGEPGAPANPAVPAPTVTEPKVTEPKVPEPAATPAAAKSLDTDLEAIQRQHVQEIDAFFQRVWSRN